MTKPTAFKATYVDIKTVKTRGVYQVIFEGPLADSDIAYQVLGGLPNPATEKWFGIAALKSDAVDKPAAIRKAVAPDKKLAQQAGIACGERLFWKFLDTESEEDTAAVVRAFCGVGSRAEIIPGSVAAERWGVLFNDFVLWRDHPDLVPDESRATPELENVERGR